MATVIDSFMITLGLDPTDFNKGIDEADKKTESFASKLTKKGTLFIYILRAFMCLCQPHSLGCNNIGDEGAKALGQALQTNTALVALALV